MNPRAWRAIGAQCTALLCMLLLGCTADLSVSNRQGAPSAGTISVAGAAPAERGRAPSYTDSAQQPSARTVDSATWTPVWARGGRQDDALFGTVRQVVPLHDVVLTADEGTLEIHAFARKTGEHRFTVGGAGGGPGEFRQLTDVLVLPDSQFAVYDRSAQRLTRYSLRGALLGTAPIPPALSGAESLCATTTPWLAGVTRMPSAWVTIAEHSAFEPTSPNVTLRAEPTTHTIAMPLVERAPRETASRQNSASFYGYSARFAQGFVHSSCVMVTRFALGVAHVTMPTGAGRTHTLLLSPFVERLPVPRFSTTTQRVGRDLASTTVMDEGHTAMVHASRWHDTVAVTFLGAPSPNKPLLDLYSTLGAYLATWVFPAPVEFGAYADGMLFTIGGSGVAPQLVAWRRRSASAPSSTN